MSQVYLNPDFTVDFLRSILDYDRSTGIFYWRHRSDSINGFDKKYAGKPAGYLNKLRGYLIIRINTRGYSAHRLAWFYVHGEWPKDQIDHINGIKTDNRIDNLREATNQQNGFNKGIMSTNTSGVSGIGIEKRTQKWRSYITINGQYTHLGLFPNEDEAIAARLAAEERYFGEYKSKRN